MTDILAADHIVLSGRASTRDEAIREAGGILVRVGAVAEDYIDAMFEREKSVSTYMGNYLAIPHGTYESTTLVRRSALSVVRYDRAIDWNGREVRFAAGIAGYQGTHLEVLSRLIGFFTDEQGVDRLFAASTPQQLLDILDSVNED